MFLTIALRKEVETPEQGQVLFDLVKNKLSDHPEVVITGTVNSTLPLTEQEPPV